MSLFGLVVLNEYKERENKNEDVGGLGEYSKKYTRTLSPVIMSVIRDIAREI